MAALSTEPAAPAVTALPHRADVLAMVAGAALLSCTSIFVVLAQVGPAVSAFYRMLFGGVALLGWVVITGRWRPMGRRDVLLALLPALGLAGDLLLWHRSILWVGPGVATLLTNFQVFLLALVGFSRKATGREIEHIGRRLRGACDHISGFIGGVRPPASDIEVLPAI